MHKIKFEYNMTCRHSVIKTRSVIYDFETCLRVVKTKNMFLQRSHAKIKILVIVIYPIYTLNTQTKRRHTKGGTWPSRCRLPICRPEGAARAGSLIYRTHFRNLCHRSPFSKMEPLFRWSQKVCFRTARNIKQNCNGIVYF